MKRLCSLVRILLVPLFLIALTAAGPGVGSRPSATAAAKISAPRQVAIDLDRAIGVKLPAITADLVPARFRTADGREGWILRIPGGRPIATPAFWNGRLFVGGGYGSHEFYAVDAATGVTAWKIKTSDDGPTAAVVEDGCVAFNTESCTVMVLDAQTGRTLWQEWLGDPLMSQPAISRGRLYMSYPGNPRGPQVQMMQGTAGPKLSAPPGRGDERGWSHRLLCAELRTGRHLWVRAIPAEVITAPVIEGEKVFLTCFDGSSLCLSAADGRILWHKNNGATSAPVVAAGQVVLTEKQSRGGEVREGIRRVTAEAGVARDTALLAAGKAEYLRAGRGGSTALSDAHLKQLDASVGFGTAPASAGLGKAAEHLNVGTVAGGWAYQGSRAAYRGGSILNAQGQYLNCVVAKDGKVAWRAQARGRGVDGNAQLFAPPALGQKNLYACTAQGHVLAVRQKDGALLFAYALGTPMAFQPALAGGSLFAGTSNGMLVCLETGDPDADGWHAWGGNAQHNKGD